MMDSRIGILLTVLLAVALTVFLVLDGDLEILKLTVLILLVSSAIFALIFVMYGEEIVYRIPTVRQFNNAYDQWSTLKIDASSMQASLSLGDFAQLRFQELSDSSNSTLSADAIKHYRMGGLVTVISRKKPPLRHLTRELRYYSAAFFIVFFLGFVFHAAEFQDKSLSQIADAVLSEQVIPILEVAAIIYLSIRFMSEMGLLRSLIEGE